MESIFERSISRSYKIQLTGVSYWLFLVLVFTLLAKPPHVAASTSDSPRIKFDGIIQHLSSWGRIKTRLTQSTPALGVTIDTIIGSSKKRNNNYGKSSRNSLQEITSVRTVSVSSVEVMENNTKKRIRDILEFAGSTGFYYGIDPERMIPKGVRPKKRRPKVEESLDLALEELKMLRLEMKRMHADIQQMKRKMIGVDDNDYSDDHLSPETKAKALRKRRDEAEKLAAQIESWATAILEEGEKDGWTPVECNKMIRASVNENQRMTAFIKWMVDPRAEKADQEDKTKHPCIKCSSTIDAPLELVCTYLSQPGSSPDYNDVVDKFADLEEISPNAKICWSSSPQILFVKPRDFVTFCHHRWKSDGTEVIVNQACEHPKYPLKTLEKEGKSCRGYALRGANFISRCSEDPSKTKITIVAHCRPGGGLPEWATKTAVKALAPIEPFKLFHKINEQVIRNQDLIQKRVQEAEETGSKSPPGRSSRPGGFAQIGYACFWPNGGGKAEQVDISPSSQSDSHHPSEDHEDAREHEEFGSLSGETQEEHQNVVQ